MRMGCLCTWRTGGCTQESISDDRIESGLFIVPFSLSRDLQGRGICPNILPKHVVQVFCAEVAAIGLCEHRLVSFALSQTTPAVIGQFEM